MRTRTYQKDVRAAALRDELIAAGVPVLAVRPPEVPGGSVTIVLADEAVDAVVDQVVAAHDAAAIDAARAQRDAEDTDDRAGFKDIYQAIRAKADDFRTDAANMPATLTNAQIRGRLIAIENGLADLADIVARLGRYVGRHT